MTIIEQTNTLTGGLSVLGHPNRLETCNLNLLTE
jgi:hypothetical protein